MSNTTTENTTTENTTLGTFDDRGAACATVNNHNRTIMLAMLKRMGIARVRIDFDGGGDTGQVQGIICDGITTNPKEHQIEDVLLATVKTRFGKPQWEYEVELKRMRGGFNAPLTLHKVIEEWAYELLGGVEHDWVNNEGGYGEITVTPTPPEGEEEIAIDLSIRVIRVESYYITA